jgi:beta-glucosidase-like glycosyl hydrolase
MVDARDSDLSPRMPLADKIAQLIVVRIGSNLPPAVTTDDDEPRITELLEACPIGGLLLFNGTRAETPHTLARLQKRSRYPLLVASDIERGVGQQIRGYTLFPHAAALARAQGGVDAFVQSVAGEAREVGIHIALAPVADVATNPANPIISIRAFSANPRQAADLSAHYVALAKSFDLLPTTKHFPGHGDTHQDSHDSLPSVEKSLDELRACELVPFQAAVDNGCSLVMTAHVAFPNIDPSGLPATLSPILLKTLLRQEMGFRGVICSDSLLMAGVRDLFTSEGEMALVALEAGVDLLLDVKDPVAVVDHLRWCVDAGTLSTERVDEAFTRVWMLKERIFRNRSAAQASPTKVDPSLADRIARQAIEVRGDGRDMSPLRTDKSLVAILLKPFETALDPPEQPLAEALRARFRDVQYLELGPRSNSDAYEAARQLAVGEKQLLVAMIVRPAAWHAFGLLPQQAEFVRRLSAERPFALVSLGAPYILDDYSDVPTRICTYSDVPASQRALVEVLLEESLAR